MAKLYINKDITRESDKMLHWWYTGDEGISYMDINDFLAKMPRNDNRIDVELYSCGGDCTEGFAIYDALRTCGKKITTTVVAECASMATVIMLAAPVESRKAFKHARFLIHEPYYPSVSGDVDLDRIESLRQALEADKNKILNIYKERTGKSEKQLTAQMEKGGWFDTDRAKELGLISEVVPETAGAAIERDIISTTIDDKEMTEKEKNKKKDTDKSLLAKAYNAIGAALGLNKDENSADLTLTATDGTEINVDTDGSIKVGDKASPDGTFTLEDGRTITIKDGEITEIKEADNGKGKKKESKKDGVEQVQTVDTTKETIETTGTQAKIIQLENQVADLKKQLEEARKACKTEAEIKVLNAVELLGGQDFLKKLPIGNMNIPQVQHQGNADTPPPATENAFKARLENGWQDPTQKKATETKK